jgi:hypothetical protein
MPYTSFLRLVETLRVAFCGITLISVFP